MICSNLWKRSRAGRHRCDRTHTWQATQACKEEEEEEEEENGRPG
jgi:hypothetical protein